MMEGSPLNSFIRPPEPFSFDPDSEKWEYWKARFLRYLNVSDQSEKPDARKIDLLIYFMGAEAEEIYSKYTQEPRTFESVIKHFDRYFNPKRTTISSRTVFLKRVQRREEPFDEFLSDLQKIADDCEFGAVKDDLVRDRIVAGMRDAELSRRLQSRGNLTLEETFEAVKQAEDQNKRRKSTDSILIDESNTTESEPPISNHRTAREQGLRNSSFSSFNRTQESSNTSLPSSSVKKEIIITIDDDDEDDEKIKETVNTYHRNSSFTSSERNGVNFYEEEEVEVGEAVAFNRPIGNFISYTSNGHNETEISVVHEPEEDALQRTKNAVTGFKSKSSANSTTPSPLESKKKRATKEKVLSNKISSSVKNSNSNYISKKSVNHLSEENLLNIFSYLTMWERIKIERVCKKWKEVSLKSWKNVKYVQIAEDFCINKFKEKELEAILRRCGDFITHLDCSEPEDSLRLPAYSLMRIINKNCKKLICLGISNTWHIKHQYLDELDPGLVKNLQSLTIGGDCFEYERLHDLLKDAINLKNFTVHGYNFKENKLYNLSQKCKTLSIVNSEGLSDVMLQKILLTHPNIENLNVSNTNITPQALIPFTNQLKSLCLQDMTNFLDSDLNQIVCNLNEIKAQIEFPQFPNLRVLDLNHNGNTLTNSDFTTLIKNCPNIEDLGLQGAKNIYLDSFRYLKKLKNLNYLNVSQTKITYSVLSSIAKELGSLKMLSCYGCALSYASRFSEIITACCQLSELEISSNHNYLSKTFIQSSLRSVQKRKGETFLTITVRANRSCKVDLDCLYTPVLKEGMQYSLSNILRVVRIANSDKSALKRPPFSGYSENM